MNKINILFLLVASLLMFNSCIDETFPEGSTATSGQIGASASALEASLNGIPSQMTQGYYVYNDQVHETDMSYPLFMIAQTEMLGDVYPLGENTGYDWYRNYNIFERAFGENSYFSYLPWFTLYKLIKSTNDIIGSVDIEDETLTTSIKGAAGVAFANRAFFYYLAMVFFEPVENIYTDVSKVKGLTVPFVTENTTADDAKNNPRATRKEMIDFIISDLDKAEILMADYTPKSKLFPSLAVIYGIKAKVYLWDEQYDKAAEFAGKAIDSFGGSPITETQWDDPKTGFNTVNQAWMWYATYSAENMENLANFTGWMSPESDWSYGTLAKFGIDRSLYDKIDETDFRKRTFLHPDKFGYYKYKTVRDADFINDAPDYLSIKFRCREGDWQSYTKGGVSDIPIMRVEEMYLIEAEATGMSKGVGAGVSKLNSFMKSYRQSNYNYSTDDLRSFQLEVLTQMRIEFWGEGNAFPSAKRIKPDIIQNYEGTNAPGDVFQINLKGIKPNWNLVIPIEEMEANSALTGLNNPDPTGTVTGPTPIGSFAN